MGVMRCDRTGCENILCDHYSSEYGYICYECLEELKLRYPQITIEQFMSSTKSSRQFESDEAKAALQVINATFTTR